jgi:uncharacterized protein involved in type VI secretion and phage assembly
MDAIDHFGALRQVMPNAVAISSWDLTQIVAVAAEQATSLAIGDLPSLAVYRGDGERRYLDAGTAGLRSTPLLQALALDNKAFNGGGAVRQLAAGHVFQLIQHCSFADGDDRFTVLVVDHPHATTWKRRCRALQPRVRQPDRADRRPARCRRHNRPRPSRQDPVRLAARSRPQCGRPGAWWW